MKKYINYLFAMTLLFLISCQDDDLDPSPADAFTPETFYKTPSDFTAASRGMYSGMIAGTYYGGSMLSRPDIMTDNVILAQIGRRSNQFFYEWRFVPNSTWNLMSRAYIINNRANRIIESIDNLPDGSIKNNFLGEAKAVRAFVMFDLLRLYSKLPTQSSDALSSLGMPIVTTTEPDIQELRPTVQETLDFVINELEDARSLIAADNGNTRFDKDGVNALLSRVYLYSGNYDLSVARANAVLEPIASRVEFSDIWTDSNSAGVILKIDQDRSLDGITVGVEWSQSGDAGLIPEYVATKELADLYENNDIRKTAYLSTLPDSNGDLYNAIVKMFGEAGQQNGIVDPKLIRKAEVILNKAEAQYKSTSFSDADALQTLDLLRNNRYAGFVSPNETGQSLLESILLERRLELAFEGHRFFDLKRLNLPVNRSSTEGEFFDGSGTPAQFNSLPNTDHRFQMAIPQSQINIFPAFQQNPGY